MALRCRFGRHAWPPWGLVDDEHPVVRLWFCARCQTIVSVQ